VTAGLSGLVWGWGNDSVSENTIVVFGLTLARRSVSQLPAYLRVPSSWRSWHSRITGKGTLARHLTCTSCRSAASRRQSHQEQRNPRLAA